MNPAESLARLAEAQDRQDRLHRRRPELKIHGATHARAMVAELGLVSVNAATELPNLVDPIVGRRATGAERVYSEPAGVLKDWLPAILADENLLELKVFRQEATLVGRRHWPLLDPVARHFGVPARQGELLSPMGRKMLAALDKLGPLRGDRLRRELGIRTAMDSKALKQARLELDIHSLIVPVYEAGQPPTSPSPIVETWDRFSARVLDRRLIPRTLEEAWVGLAELVIRAAVVVPEKAIPGWFPWTRPEAKETVDHLVTRGLVERLEVGKQSWLVLRT